MEIKARDKLIKARAALVLDQPFFATIALRLGLKEDKTAQTAWTDSKIIGYNPAYIDSISLEECKGLLCHEVMHIAAAHHLRRDGRTPEKWNRAADYAINGLIAPLMALPKGGLIDAAYNDLSAEAIYGRLPDEPGKSDDDGNQSGDPGGCGEIRDLKNGSGQDLGLDELERAQAEIKIMVAQAAQAARAMGQMPAGLERFTDGIIKPKMNPYETLRRFITETARDGLTWNRPNKRFMDAGLYMPARRSLELKPLAIAVDTSGSISPADLSQFEAEINAILEEYKTYILLVYCDSAAARIEEIKSDDLPIRIKAVGGGGTDFRPVFQEIEKRAYTPSVMIYLTDLCGEFPDKAPDYPVLWAKIGDEDIKPPFGEVIQI